MSLSVIVCMATFSSDKHASMSQVTALSEKFTNHNRPGQSYAAYNQDDHDAAHAIRSTRGEWWRGVCLHRWTCQLSHINPSLASCISLILVALTDENKLD